MRRLALVVACLVFASAPARAEDEFTQQVPGPSAPMAQASAVGKIDRPTYGPPLFFDYARNLDSTPPLGDRMFRMPTGKMDKASYTFDLIKHWNGQPFLVQINAVPAYSTFNIDHFTNNNAFGNKLKLSAIGKLDDRLTVGAFLSYQAETELFVKRWQPSSQAGVAGFISYEITKDIFIGAEARYWNSYTHLYATRPVAHEFHAGPNVGWRCGENCMLTLSYAPRLNRDTGARSDFARNSRFNADVFDNHPLRFKLEFKF